MNDGLGSPAPPGSPETEHDASIGEQAQEVAGQAQEKAREAADRAQQGVRQQIDERSAQAGERVSGTARDLRSVGEELRKQGKDTPARLADRAAEQTERVGAYLKESDADRMLADVERFGRQRPLAVLAGGLVVGAAAARFLKASSRDRYRQQSRSEEPTRTPATSGGQALSKPAQAPAPVAPVPQPPPSTVPPNPIATP